MRGPCAGGRLLCKLTRLQARRSHLDPVAFCSLLCSPGAWSSMVAGWVGMADWKGLVWGPSANALWSMCSIVPAGTSHTSGVVKSHASTTALAKATSLRALSPGLGHCVTSLPVSLSGSPRLR